MKSKISKKLKQHVRNHVDRIKAGKKWLIHLKLFLLLLLGIGAAFLSHFNGINAQYDPGDPYTATFIANGADSIGDDELVGVFVIAPSITREGWEILGWSTNSGATEGVYEVGDEIELNDDMTLYAITKRVYTVNFQENGADSIGATTGSCEAYNTDIVCREKTAQSVSATRLIYNVGTDITICDPNDPTNCMTMMDKILGASSNDITTAASYGNHYKRGNNIGVMWTESSSAWQSVYEMSWAEGTQGPCPDEYHIPTEGEWTSLLNIWKGSNGQLDGTEAVEFKSDFKISNGGRRSFSYNVNDRGVAAYLWSSTNRRVLIIRDDFSNFINNGTNYGGYGNNIRCFKNTPSLPEVSSLKAPTITRDGWEIIGWSTDSGATEGEYEVGDKISLSEDTTLYAITKRVYIVNFQENGAESIGASTGLCEAYNTDTVCREKPAQSVSATRLIYNVGTDITICDTSNPTNCMTMMDRNLGADSNDTTTTASRGNHYKRGNNIGVIRSASSSTFAGLSEGTQWTEGGQGPCPEDYHIPTATEWTTLLAMWKGSEGHLSTSEEVLQFNSDFKLPTAGRRSNGNNVNSIGNIAFLWTSTPTRQVFFVNIGSTFTNIISSTYNYGNSIRCFKDTPSLPEASSLKAPTITRDGWEIVGWSTDNDGTVGEYEVGDNLSVSGDTTLYAITRKDTLYTATLDKNGADSIGEDEVSCTGSIYNTSDDTPKCNVILPEITRNGWTVVGWSIDSGSTTAEYQVGDTVELANNTTTLYAITQQSQQQSSSSPSSGRSGGSRTPAAPKDDCPDGDKSPSEYDGTCLSDNQTGDTGTEKNIHGSASCSIENSKHTEELNGAYQYACKVGITTMDTIQKADMTGPLLRKHLAKMVSEFAMEELGMQPNTGKVCKFNDMADETQEMQKYAELACQLGFMGLYSDGIKVKDNFDPNNQVTRAEFGTVLSRLLWGTKYAANDGDVFYKRHLEVLREKGIMTKISGNWPSSIELRGYVMLMFKRVSELEM